MTVINLLAPLAGLVKVRYQGSKADIDSPFFKLHYRTSATICFLCCILVTANDLIGKTIDCITTDLPENVINNYCWIMSTFSMPANPEGNHGEHFAYPGVEPGVPGKEKKYHAYYQWVPFVLFFQGLMFYLPHYIWKTLEDRRLDKITKGLRGRTLNVDERKDQCEILVKYFKETFHTHNFYAFKYFLCDILNFVNVIGQMYMINAFLGGVFMAYGTDVLYWNEAEPEERTDPMIRVFPRITKCEFYKYGPSGTIQRHDIMCVLALNIINEKIYIFLWFWYIILAVLTSLYMLYVLSVIAMPGMRRFMVERNAKHDIKERMDVLMKKAQMGDWFVIFLLSKNLDSILFREFICQLSDKLRADA